MSLRSILFLFVFVLVAVDQVSKRLVESYLPFQEPVGVIPFFSLFRTYNTGIAFSMLQWAGNLGLVAIAIVVIGLMFYLWTRVRADQQLAHIGFSLVIAGALGNLIDRLTQGHVIDFFLFHTDTWAFAVFNVADAFITLGAIAIIVDELFSGRREATQS